MATEIKVEKSILIDQPVSKVFGYVKFCRNMEHYSVWNMADPGKKTTSQGEDGQVGFIYSWDSKDKNVGAGSQEITGMEEGNSITYQLRFERPMKSTSVSTFMFSSSGENQTKLHWDFRGPTKFPMRLFAGIFARMLGKDLQKSLENLKRILEN